MKHRRSGATYLYRAHMAQYRVESIAHRGIELFNRAKFFEAHEVLEDVWRASPKEEKKFWQGLVQIAVAFHHHSTGNFVGMRSVMERGMRNLTGCSWRFEDVRLHPLLDSLNEWRAALNNQTPTPPLPRITTLNHP